MASFFRKLISPPKERPSAIAGVFSVLMGAAVFAFLFGLFVWPDMAVGAYWTTAPCAVLESRVAESKDSDGSTYRAEIRIRYEYQGKTSEIWSTHAGGAYSSGKDGKVEEIQRFPPGPSYTCWVNPKDPTNAVILRGLGVEVLSLLFPLIFILSGLRSFYYAFALRNKSPEEIHQSSQEEKTTCIPPASSEPGVHLPFRLHHEKDIGGSIMIFFLAMFLSFFEVALLVALVGVGISGVGMIVLLFCIVVGFLALLMWHDIFTKTRVALRVPLCQFEVSASPARPGVPFDLYIEQPKASKFVTFSVNLICEESATDDRGSDSSTTKKHEAYMQSILSPRPLAGEGQQSFVYRTRVVLPANAMHSLDAPHNKITWKFVVSGNTTASIDFRREVLLVVHPPKPERATGYRDTHTS